jgi:hypothetical protein
MKAAMTSRREPVRMRSIVIDNLLVASLPLASDACAGFEMILSARQSLFPRAFGGNPATPAADFQQAAG